MPEPAPTSQAVVDRLTQSSTDVRVALLLGGDGTVVAHAGTEQESAGRLGDLAGTLLRAGDAAGSRAGLEAVNRIEVSRPEGAVFAVRDPGHERTLVTVADGGALSSLLLYDMRMALDGSGADASGSG